MSESKRAAIYIRVSDVGQRDRESPSYQTEDVQEHRCRAMAASRGATVVEVLRDIDVRGTTWNRIGLNRVMELAAGGAIDMVIVYYVSRLGRSLIGSLQTVQALQDSGVELVSVNEGFDLSTNGGRMMFQMLAMFAEYESRNRGEHWRASREQAEARGVWVGRTPFGYQRNSETKVLEPHPDQAPVVVEMFQRRAKGASIRELARLIDMVKPLKNGKPRSGGRTLEIILNPKYRGAEPLAPRLVEDDIWFAAQDVHAVTERRSGSHDFFLSGIARCATCGGSMSGHSFGGVNHDTPVYTCSTRSNRGMAGCPTGPTIVAHRIEPWVIEAARSAGSIQGRPSTTHDLGALDRATAVAEQRRTRHLHDDETRDLIGEEEWRNELRRHSETLEACREAAAKARNEIAAMPVVLAWDDIEGDPMRLRQYLRSRIVSLTVTGGRGKSVDERCTLELLR